MGYRVAHVGAFDIENYGDLLFADVVEKQLRKRIDIDEIVYFAPNSCTMPNTKRKVYSLLNLDQMASTENFDAIIIGGGDFIHLKKVPMFLPHICDDWKIYEPIYMWVIPILVAKKHNIQLLWNAPGVPLSFHENEKKIVNFLCQNSDYISVRDNEAKKVLSECIEDEQIHVVPDTVLSISELIKKEELDLIFLKLDLPIKSGKYVLFQGNVSINDTDLKICADTLKKIKDETGFNVILQPIGFALGDEDVLKKIKSFYPEDFILCEHHTQYEILSLVANAFLYIGTSLHGCITSTSYGVRNITYNLNHYNKTEGFNELMKQKNNIVYNAEDIYTKYKMITQPNLQLLKMNIDGIDHHFDLISGLLSKKIAKENVLDVNQLADYIFHASEYENNYYSLLEEKNNMQSQIDNLNLAIKQLENDRDEIVNSKCWKITQPLRTVLDKTKK